MMRGKALECISLVGAAVGKAQFGADAVEMMEYLVRLQESAGAKGGGSKGEDLVDQAREAYGNNLR